MSLLDSYAVLAYLKDEPAAREVERLIERGGRLTAVGVSEVLDHLIRIMGGDEEEAMLDLGQLRLLDPVPVDTTLGTTAGRLRAKHYHRTRRAISLADAIAAEAARRLEKPLATSDPHLLDTCHAEGIEVHVLPDSSGTTWVPTGV